MASKRAIMRIQLETGAKTALERVSSRRGMTQIAMMTRLVQWFVRQDEVIQTAVMNSLSDEAIASLSRTLLKRYADRG
jgi:hypothetical protein